jgi:hypothetical protein
MSSEAPCLRPGNLASSFPEISILAAFDPKRFPAREKVFVEAVRRWVDSRFEVTLPAERTAVCGVSARGEQGWM